MRYRVQLRVGPRSVRVGSDWSAPIRQLQQLYRGYPDGGDGVADYTVRLEATHFWRRFLRPSVAIRGDHQLPDALPLPLSQGLLAAEMAMNLQMALGERELLLLHASTVEKDGKALLMTGESGSGKSTLSALLAERGWRFLGDEFALLDPQNGMVVPFPRPVSLKNESIALMAANLPLARFGPVIAGTPKGTIRHLVPPQNSLDQMAIPATPALLLFPRFGHAKATRELGKAEAFLRLTQASTNYVALGERGFNALTGLVNRLPMQAIDYPDTNSAIALVEELWAKT